MIQHKISLILIRKQFRIREKIFLNLRNIILVPELVQYSTVQYRYGTGSNKYRKNTKHRTQKWAKNTLPKDTGIKASENQYQHRHRIFKSR
jgi:hypothetical protein